MSYELVSTPDLVTVTVGSSRRVRYLSLLVAIFIFFGALIAPNVPVALLGIVGAAAVLLMGRVEERLTVGHSDVTREFRYAGVVVSKWHQGPDDSPYRFQSADPYSGIVLGNRRLGFGQFFLSREEGDSLIAQLNAIEHDSVEDGSAG